MTDARKRRMAILCAAALAALACACAARKEPAPAEPRPLGEAIENSDEVVASIRSGLRDYSSRITVAFSYDAGVIDELSALAGDWIEAALEETDDPTEGDYIRYQLGGYETACRSEESGGRGSYTLEIIPNYYIYRYQADEVTEKLAEVYEELALDGAASDYEKIRAIYDYVCRTVKYDRIHVKNPYYHTKSTAYAALIRRTATCQGYCVLLYRMLRDHGIDCRVVTGAGNGLYGEEQLHAWNIVALDGRYYNLDATWDSELEEYAYFLRGKSFSDHTPGEEFRAAAFAARYPMAEEDYPTAVGEHG